MNMKEIIEAGSMRKQILMKNIQVLMHKTRLGIVMMK